MITQAQDFLDETNKLYELLKDDAERKLATPTLFRDWTVEDVIGHLHIWNHGANLTLTDGDGFHAFFAQAIKESGPRGLKDFEIKYLGDLKGVALLEKWHEFAQEVCENYLNIDPKMRLKWAGPDMSALSCITARLMETWAHGQEVYDAMGADRVNTDAIKNIAYLGINTFGWTYACRKMTPPAEVPYVKLTAPSGAIWEWNDPENENRVEGDAAQFCQVVTQTRNIADTDLKVSGPIATEWMGMAQCFAGAAAEPPAPGARHKAVA